MLKMVKKINKWPELRRNILDLVALHNRQLMLRNLRKSLKFRRYWEKPYLKLRDSLGAYRLVFEYFKDNDHEDFKKLTRMSIDDFNLLHDLVKRKLEKSSYRKPISTELRLASVIVMFAHGNTLSFNAMMFRIGKSTMSNILREVCLAIIEVLKPVYMPDLSKDTWLRISQEFEDVWNLPHCLGALDGRHFELEKPANSGSIFFNYKKFFSIILLAICDAHKRFVWFNVGQYGSFNDASVFMSSDLYEKMCEKTLDIPEPSLLKGTSVSMPFFFVGDSIFALHENLMKPYTRSEHLGKDQQIYNYRISRARITIECAFGILTSRWRIFNRPLAHSLATNELIIIAAVMLHNFLITRELNRTKVYSATDTPTEQKNYVDEVDNRILGNSEKQRQELVKYFKSPAGSVPWQNKYVT